MVLLMEIQMQLPLHVLVIAMCVLIIAGDLWERRVRNKWLLYALIFGAAWMIWRWAQDTAGPPWPAVLGLSIGLVVSLPFYVLRCMGAGDVKLFAVLGFLLGGKALLPIWIIASLLGGVHAAVVLLWRYWMRYVSPGLIRLQRYVEQSRLWQRILVARQGRKGLPYAAYMAMAALFTIYVPTLTRW